MAKKNRDTLRKHFRTGSMPSQEHFEDLIDSMLNVVDEGFDKTPEQGFEVAQLGGSGKLISFFENITVKSPLWSISFDSAGNNLAFGSASNPHVLVLATEKDDGQGVEKVRIGINKEKPQYELDVDGIVAAQGRIGSKIKQQIKADGVWHDVTEVLDGCQAFEIMAGVGGMKQKGQYALLHAYALNTYNDRSKIDSHPAYYGSRCNQLELRWKGDMHAFKLQLRSKCSYTNNDNKPVLINCYLTRLWFDPHMTNNDQA